MACINYTVCTAAPLLLCWQPPTVAPRQKSGCCQWHRERADCVTSRLNQHPVCICLPGVSSSVQYMFKIAETGNEVRWPDVLAKLGSEGNIVTLTCRWKHWRAPFVPQDFYFFKISLWPWKQSAVRHQMNNIPERRGFICIAAVHRLGGSEGIKLLDRWGSSQQMCWDDEKENGGLVFPFSRL